MFSDLDDSSDPEEAGALDQLVAEHEAGQGEDNIAAREREAEERARQRQQAERPARRRRPRTRPEPEEADLDHEGPGGGGGGGGGIVAGITAAAAAAVAADDVVIMRDADGTPVVRSVATPVCNSILNEHNPDSGRFAAAFDELRRKWVGVLTGKPEHMIPQLLANFNLDYNPDTRQLRLATNKAGEDINPRQRRRRRGQQNMANYAQAVGVDAGGAEVRDIGEAPRPGDHDTHVYDYEALEHARETEAHLAYYLQAYCNVEHFELDQWMEFSSSRRSGMLDIIDIINNAYRLLQHWFQITRLVYDQVRNVDQPSEEEQDRMRNFPMFLSGIEGRLSLHMQELTPYRKVMLYILSICRERKYRRHGDELYSEKFIPKMTLVKDPASGECVCDRCGKRESEHHKRDVRSRPQDHVFKPAVEVDDQNKYGTFAWVPLEHYSKISEFVRYCVARHRAPTMWLDSLLDRDRMARELAQTVHDLDLPQLDRTCKRHGLALSFQNGIYFAFKNEFITYDKIERSQYPDLTAHYIDAWFHEEQHRLSLRGRRSLDPAKRDWPECYRYEHIYEHWKCKACNQETRYHNDNMCPARRVVAPYRECALCHQKEDECECEGPDGEQMFHCYKVDIKTALKEIQTPYVDGILEKQLMQHADYGEMYFWIFVMMGRFLFPLDPKRFDDWQKLFCIFGNAGTGKSCLLILLRALIPPELFTTLSMNSQETFGLETLLGPNNEHLRCMIFEVTGRFKIPPQQIQSMTSGEGLSINRKNKRAYVTENWSAHMMIAGNSKPAWEDLAFSLVRRLMPIYMRHDVTDKDAQLVNRCMANTIDAFAFKCVTAYLWAIEHYGSKDLWSKDPYMPNRYILPETMRAFNQSIRTSMNPLWSMLKTGLGTCKEPMTLHPRFYMTLDAFITQYNEYCATHFRTLKRQDLTEDIYAPVFGKFGLVVKTKSRMWQGSYVKTKFIKGIGINDCYPSQVEKLVKIDKRRKKKELALSRGEEWDSDDGRISDPTFSSADEDSDQGDHGDIQAERAAQAAAVRQRGDVDNGAGLPGMNPDDMLRNPPPAAGVWKKLVEKMLVSPVDVTAMNEADLTAIISAAPLNFGWRVLLNIVKQMDTQPDVELLQEVLGYADLIAEELQHKIALFRSR